MPNFYKLNKYVFPQISYSYIDETVNTVHIDETSNCKIIVKYEEEKSLCSLSVKIWKELGICDLWVYTLTRPIIIFITLHEVIFS